MDKHFSPSWAGRTGEEVTSKLKGESLSENKNQKSLENMTKAETK